MIESIKFDTGVAAGADGSATSTGYSHHVAGKIMAVHVAYLDSPPAGTTDFTLSDESDPASESIITLTDAATDIKIYPRRLTETNDGTDIVYNGGEKVYDYYVVEGRLKATIAQANANDYCNVTVWIER